MIVSSYTIDRGRGYELDRNSPGTASVTLIDTTGELDPTGVAYSFNPMTPAAIALRNPVTSTDHTIFRGHVKRLNYNLYESERYAVVTVEMADGLDRLGRMEMFGGQGFASEWGDFPRISENGDITFFADDQTSAVANRINKILNQANWPVGLREVFSGNVAMQGNVYAHRTPALAALQDCADAEFPGVSTLLVLKDGRLAFHGRLARFIPDDVQYHIAKWRCGDTAAVTADSTRALIFGLEYDRDAEKVINTASATPQNIPDADIDDQRIEDAGSIASYGTRAISFENLLTTDGLGYQPEALDQTELFAQYYVTNYAQPRNRVNKIMFERLDPGHPNAARQWALMCGVDISDIIRLKTTHIGGGFDEDFYVEGLHYQVRPLKDTYMDVRLTLDVSPRAYYDTNPF